MGKRIHHSGLWEIYELQVNVIQPYGASIPLGTPTYCLCRADYHYVPLIPVNLSR